MRHVFIASAMAWVAVGCATTAPVAPTAESAATAPTTEVKAETERASDVRVNTNAEMRAPRGGAPDLNTYLTAGVVVVASPYSVAETLDRLAGAAEEKGATIFARIDHAAGAASVGQDLEPMEVLIFGNPNLGTPALQAGPTMGIDLPLRVLAWEQAGSVFVAYPDIEDLAVRHGLLPDDPALVPIGRALEALTGQAVRAE